MANCKACDKEIYFLKTINKKFIPINAESLNKNELYDLQNGMNRLYDSDRHVSHFADCPKAKNFRKEKINADS